VDASRKNETHLLLALVDRLGVISPGLAAFVRAIAVLAKLQRQVVLHSIQLGKARDSATAIETDCVHDLDGQLNRLLVVSASPLKDPSLSMLKAQAYIATNFIKV
jgi:hypothetical protein